MIAQSCPTADRWQAHLKGELPAVEQAELTAHLDACAACQQTIDTLAVAADSLLAVARRVGQEAATHETALEGAIRAAQAHTEAEPTPPTGNHFAYLDPPTAPGQLGRLAHYAILEVVGQGGMGIVFKALDERLQRIVAIKVLSPAYATNELARQRFQREAKAAAAVSHDHVVPIYHVDEANGVVYLVMPLIVGKSLEERIEQTGPLALEELLRIGMQIASGLAAAHNQGLVHRDIKPANILLENGVERVKITDFGLARTIDDARLTQSGVIAGTPLYMSPEQARGEGVIDARSDLFSLGSVLYAMATGRPPFRATGSMAVLKRVCDETPRPLRQLNPDMPAWLEAIVAKLHAKWPGDRFQSAQEVADLLGQHLAHLQQPRRVPRPAPVAGPAGPARQRSVGLSPLGIAAVIFVAFLVLNIPIGVVVLAYFFFAPEPRPQGAPVVEMHAEARGEPMEAKAPDPGPVQAQRAVDGWVPLFRDKGLNGWKGLARCWRMENQFLIGSSLPDGVDFNTFLVSERRHRDFELKFQVRLDGDKANSGVQIRSTLVDPDRCIVVGPQCDIGETHWGDLFQEGPGSRLLRRAAPGVLDTIRPGNYNSYHIRCIGKRVTITVNGFVTVDEEFPDLPAAGVIAWQIHRGAMQVVFRDIWLKDLGPP
jgi:hypothetical protein